MWGFLKRYQLFIFLGFVIGVLVVVKISFPEIVKETTQNIIVSPTVGISPISAVTPTPDITNYEIIADKLMPLWRLLPYQGDGFVVENYAEVGVLIVRKKDISEAETRIRVEKWIAEQKQDPKEIELVIGN